MKEQEKNTDPAAAFKQYYSEMESTWSKMWDQVIASPAYAKAQGSLMDAYLSSQQAIQTNLKKQLENLNIPSKDDLAKIAFQVVQTEQKMLEIQRELARLKNLDAKMDLILAEIKQAKEFHQKASTNESKSVTKSVTKKTAQKA